MKHNNGDFTLLAIHIHNIYFVDNVAKLGVCTPQILTLPKGSVNASNLVEMIETCNLQAAFPLYPEYSFRTSTPQDNKKPLVSKGFLIFYWWR